jgi:hypothetical protein
MLVNGRSTLVSYQRFDVGQTRTAQQAYLSSEIYRRQWNSTFVMIRFNTRGPQPLRQCLQPAVVSPAFLPLHSGHGHCKGRW